MTLKGQTQGQSDFKASYLAKEPSYLSYVTINHQYETLSGESNDTINFDLEQLERSRSRSLRFSVVGYLYGIDIFASSNITTFWMSQNGVCWRAGFSAAPSVFLVVVVVIIIVALI